MSNSIYSNPKVNPIDALMEACDLPIEPLNEGVKEFFNKVIEKIKAIARRLKEIAIEIGKKITQTLSGDKAYVASHKKGIDEGYKLLAHSNATLEFNHMYTLDTYDDWVKAINTSIQDNGEYGVHITNAVETIGKYTEKILNNNTNFIEKHVAEEYAKDLKNTMDVEEEYAKTIKINGTIEYHKMREALERAFKPTDGNVKWIDSSRIIKMMDDGIKTSNEASNKCKEISKDCEYWARYLENLQKRLNMNFPLYAQLDAIVAHGVTIISDKASAFTQINAFNFNITHNVRKTCLALAKLYEKYSKTDHVEGGAKFTIGSKKEGVQESFNSSEYSPLFENVHFM